MTKTQQVIVERLNVDTGELRPSPLSTSARIKIYRAIQCWQVGGCSDPFWHVVDVILRDGGHWDSAKRAARELIYGGES